IGSVTVSGWSQEPAKLPPVQVQVQDEKPVIVEATMPVDPSQHVQLGLQGNMMVNVRVDNQTMHLGFIQTLFHYDGQVLFPGNPPGRMLTQNQALPKGRDGKLRTGSMSVCEIGKLTITQEIEVVPTKSKPGQKR